MSNVTTSTSDQQLICDEIFALNNCTTNVEKEQYLKGLQNKTRKMWEQFKKDTVSVDYSDEQIRYIYMMRYYSYYLEPIRFAFNQAMNHSRITPTTITNFASGPGPEIHGIVKAYDVDGSKCPVRQCNQIDIQDWGTSADIARTVLKENYKFDCKYTFVPQNLQSPFYSETVIECIQKAQIITVQNCLNEMDIDQRSSMIWRIISNMRKDTFLIIVDLSAYDTNLEISKNDVRKVFTGTVEFPANKVRSAIPTIVTNHLLTGASGLIPRGKVRSFIKVYQKA